ncbi:MAG TPA: hypothetical protein VFB07_01225 [Vicinamibacterales bacterium]|nr:hypothetical protein [Vicinamibacterales bacterium]
MRAAVLLPACVLFAALASSAFAGERYALVVTGASGGEAYAKKYDGWRQSFVDTLRDTFGYAQDHVIVLAEREGNGVQKSTRENVQRAVADLRRRLTRDDQLIVLLIGHGTSMDGEEAKFNLVGPDLSASEWTELLRPLPGRLVFVNTSSASFPFLRKLAGKGRIVLTATDSSAQQFETIFPEFFLKALTDTAADLDKNGRVSIWEAFTYASDAVQRAFQEKGQLPTERPLLDDTGAGIGREARNPGPDGAVAKITYLQPDAPVAVPSNAALADLFKRRAELEAEVEALKARKDTMPADQYDAELERLLIEIARVSAQIRTKS